jgi:hypothetical protein
MKENNARQAAYYPYIHTNGRRNMGSMDPPNLSVRHKAGVDHSDHLGLAGNQEDDPFQVVLVSFLHLRRLSYRRHESFGVVDELKRRFALLLELFYPGLVHEQGFVVFSPAG